VGGIPQSEGESVMAKIPFNDGWTYWKIGEESKKYDITLPYDAMLSEPRIPNSAGGVNIGWFEGGDYIYEKEFTLENYPKCKVVFEFEDIYHNAEIFMNGQNVLFQPSSA
jgi:beta-galactosidase